MNGDKKTFNLSGGIKKIIPDRIKEARIYRGLAQKELADMVGVTKQSICNYEKNLNEPTTEVLIRLSEALRFPINFFYKQRRTIDDAGEVYFRSSAIPAKTKEMLEQKLRFLANDIVGFVEDYINLPELDIIDVPYKSEYSKDDILRIAKELREYWGLSSKPIPNLTYVMQEHGCVIARLSLDSNRTDGYTKWINGRPITFLNTEKDAAVRARFTLAHELGHIILHRNLKPGEDIKRREKESNYFAGEFLIPSDSALDEIINISLDSFIPIKLKWKVSIGVIVRRCLDLDLITEDRFTLMQKQISKRRWRTYEPLDDMIEVEKPQLFKEAFTLLNENNILSKDEITDLIAFDKNELIELCCLPHDFFSDGQLSIKPKLRIVK